MALIVRCPASGRALHAIKANVDADLEALFLTVRAPGPARESRRRPV
jgi:hypothetical protein